MFIIIIFILLHPIFSMASEKLPEITANKIISFTLFNYDNLIADSYEDKSPYINQLSYLLSQATNTPKINYSTLLKSETFINEAIPVKYLMRLNKKTKDISNYYFLDE